jgi:peptide-methionine (S)-S-oxide reductase
MRLGILALAVVLIFSGNSCGQKTTKQEDSNMTKKPFNTEGLELATFGSGCFWCTEAIFLNVDGVAKVESGYTGGSVKNPTYKEVCSGLTGHAEAIQLWFDPKEVSYEELLEIFWQTHDPTTLNRQGADAGTQYRSAIFYHSDEQKKLAEFYKKKLEDANAFDGPIVTEISPASTFYVAEDYHQNYYALNSNAPYCTYVIQPKLEKFKKVFKEKLKK